MTRRVTDQVNAINDIENNVEKLFDGEEHEFSDSEEESQIPDSTKLLLPDG